MISLSGQKRSTKTPPLFSLFYAQPHCPSAGRQPSPAEGADKQTPHLCQEMRFSSFGIVASLLGYPIPCLHQNRQEVKEEILALGTRIETRAELLGCLERVRRPHRN